MMEKKHLALSHIACHIPNQLLTSIALPYLVIYTREKKMKEAKNKNIEIPYSLANEDQSRPIYR